MRFENFKKDEEKHLHVHKIEMTNDDINWILELCRDTGVNILDKFKDITFLQFFYVVFKDMTHYGNNDLIPDEAIEKMWDKLKAKKDKNIIVDLTNSNEDPE